MTSRAWYAAHADAERAKAREREQRKRELRRAELTLTDDELAAVRRDPTLAWGIRGPKWIACDICGAVAQALGQHLWGFHDKMTAERYKARPVRIGERDVPRYSKNASLCSLALQKRLSKMRKGLRLGQLLQTRCRQVGKAIIHVVPPSGTLVASRGPRSMSLQYRMEQARRMTRSRPELWGRWRGGKAAGRAVEDWEIAELAAQGLADQETARELELGARYGQSVGARRRRMGFTSGLRRARLYYHGAPVTGADVRAMCREFDLNVAQAAELIGVKPHALSNRMTGRLKEKPLEAGMAREFVKVRAGIREEARHQPARSYGGRPPALTPGERAEVVAEYTALLPELRAVVRWLAAREQEKRPTPIRDLMGWVYSEARQGRMRRLALWPEIFRYSERRGGDPLVLAAIDEKPSSLALRVLALAHGVTPRAVRRCLLRRAGL